ncbi:CxxH/CxxC protein [Heyndrickxia sp. NPDC080065]|uniref:CxxH/CxxC protein n=1 Tax=Heyndrickxia sp. NPDC080065 TaxID=3390568 RepID=UPI003D05D5E2
MIYVCADHVELALDVAVDEYETAPSLEEIQSENQLSTTCEYCDNRAIYIVGN